MATTINERPYQYSFSRNEIRYVFTVTDLTRPGLYLQVKIMYHSVTGSSGTAMSPFKLKPDADGKVYLNIQHYIDSVLKFVVPDMDALATDANEQCCKFWVEYREVTDADTNPDYEDAETAHKIVAIKGGISKEKSARNNFFINYFDTAKPWMTWQPSGRFVYIDQPLFLTAFFPDGIPTGTKILIKNLTLDGDDPQEAYDTLLTEGVLFHFNLQQLIIAQPTADYHSFKFSIIDSDNVVLINDYTVNIQYRPTYKYYDLIFNNSISGIDTVRVIGDVEWGIDKQFEETEGGFSYTEALATAKSHEIKHTAITFGQTYKGDIGFLNNKREQEAMIELIISRNIHQYKDSRFIPILNIQKANPIRKNSDELYPFAIEFTTSIREENYTPEFVTLGIGDNT
jgi:hypothetical protein